MPHRAPAQKQVFNQTTDGDAKADRLEHGIPTQCVLDALRGVLQGLGQREGAVGRRECGADGVGAQCAVEVGENCPQIGGAADFPCGRCG